MQGARLKAGIGAVTVEQNEHAPAGDGMLVPLLTPQQETTRQPLGGVIVGLFALSGAAGLIYQVVWESQLIVVFGDTTQAIGTIVAAFMAGLGLGGLVGGMIAPRLRHPLRFYGVVECCVGGLALLVPLGFSVVIDPYRTAYSSGSTGVLTLVRLGLSLALLAPVTFLMGLTLPLLTRHLVTSMRTAGARMGALYAANTLGAMAGTLVSGFLLIELIGLSSTSHVAVALNLLGGAAALLLWARGRAGAAVADHPEPARDDPAARRPGRSSHALLYSVTFVSGFTALALEVLWTRLLAEGTGSQVYDFVVVLAVFLLGVGLGGAAYRFASRPGRDTPPALALAFLGIAVGAAVTVPLVSMWLTGGHTLLRALVLLPATACMGYAFPLTARLLTRRPAHGARSIGLLYLWNTTGSILGSLAAAFVLAGSLGTNGSILVLGAADAGVALALVLLGGNLVPSRRPRRLSTVLATVSAAAVLVSPLFVATGSPVLLTSTDHQLAAAGRHYIHAEDSVSTVDAVGGPVRKRALLTSGTSMTGISVVTKLMAYIPKVVDPGASNLLDICFGMGTTFRSSLVLGMHTDAVELSPTVPTMMPVFYPDAERYLQSPLARVITADGRNYVRLTSRRYDIITVDPPPPVDSAAAAVFYSQEFYAEARQHLRPGGVFLEWLYFGGQDLQQLREKLRTFSSEFPHVVAMMLGGSAIGIYMLGSDQPITWSAATVDRVLGTPSAATDMAQAPDAAGLPLEPWPQILDGMVWLRDGQVSGFAGRGPLISDDHPVTEYYVLHELFRGSGDPTVSASLLRRLSP